jgi:hypothetical protein
MTKLAKPIFPVPNAISIDSHADDTLRYIRASMEAAASFPVPGTAGIAMGGVGICAAVLASLPSLKPHWLAIWLGAALVAGGLGGGVMTRQALMQGRTLFGAPIRKFLLCLCPALLAGVVLTGIQVSGGDLHAIPGTWLLLYGCALIAASATSTRILGLLGAVFFLLGFMALLLPPNLQNACLGAGFGGLHLLAGAFLMGRGSSGQR